MSKLVFPAALKAAVLPLLTKKLFFGAAISCAIGIGLGVWLEPPKPYYGSSTTPVVTVPEQQPNLWGDVAEASPAPVDNQYTEASTDQVAAVSPPADAQPVQLAQADAAPVAASGIARAPDPDSDPIPTPAAYASSPPDHAQPRRRDAPGYDPPDRDDKDDLGGAPTAAADPPGRSLELGLATAPH